ncbi:MAG: hypothetical protein GY854_16550 [Deltaproteobacteria bacterium]|nr:hypothetical protein [Deltaproteobacteria bacterium]
MPLQLIDKQDNFEIVRDEIAAILALETLNQQALAVLAAKDPELWRFDVFTERSRPWEALSELEEPIVPIVNVWFDDESFATDQSYNSLLHTADPGIFNIDILTTALNRKNVGDGYETSDRQATLDAQRIMRLIRNILFSVPSDHTQPGQDYQFLNMRGVVGYRRIQSATVFQPDYKKQSVAIGGARIALAVKYIETAIEGPYQNFDLLQVTATTTENGQVVMEFDLT